MKNVLLIIFIFNILIACRDNSPGNATEVQECYRYFGKNKDGVVMNLQIRNDSVTGQLEYTLHEKDHSRGSIHGIIKGDTLIADYVFVSEGIITTRQVAFLKQDKRYIEGYGGVIEKDSKMVFENTGELFFNGLELKKVICEK